MHTFGRYASHLSRNKFNYRQLIKHRREQVDLILNAMQMDDFLEIGEVLNSPLTKFITFSEMTLVIVVFHMI